MNYLDHSAFLINRRRFIGSCATGLGAAALTKLDAAAALRDFAPKAKRVIYMFQSGAPSQLETFDYKPGLEQLHKSELPDSIRQGQRVTGMTSGQASFPVAASTFKFQQHGRSGAWISELLPHHGEIVDDISIIRSMYTEAINHDPAITLMQTGTQQPGRPSFGAWASYGLGTMNNELPAFVVLISQGSSGRAAQGLLGRLWGNGFLPPKHQGVKLRSTGDPVLYLADPDGVSRPMRRDMLDGIGSLNTLLHDELGDPEINARISQYEMAFRMQASVPELTDISKEPAHIMEMYGKDASRAGSYAANCLLARRLAERGVQFIQLYHRGWDQHGNLPKDIAAQCRDVDQASAALVKDLKQRGLLDDTLIVWAGEFGRSVYCQGKLTATSYGRDHHPRCFSAWMAGGGIRPGVVHGETDDFSYNIVRDGVHVHDLQATMLHCMGIDHKRLTFPHQGRDYRLTDVHGNVVRPLLV
jgi:hypothetical protein